MAIDSNPKIPPNLHIGHRRHDSASRRRARTAQPDPASRARPASMSCKPFTVKASPSLGYPCSDTADAHLPVPPCHSLHWPSATPSPFGRGSESELLTLLAKKEAESFEALIHRQLMADFLRAGLVTHGFPLPLRSPVGPVELRPGWLGRMSRMQRRPRGRRKFSRMSHLMAHTTTPQEPAISALRHPRGSRGCRSSLRHRADVEGVADVTTSARICVIHVDVATSAESATSARMSQILADVATSARMLQNPRGCRGF